MEFVIGVVFGLAVGYVIWHVIPKNSAKKIPPAVK